VPAKVAGEGILKTIKNFKFRYVIIIFNALKMGSMGNFLLRNMKTTFLLKSNNSMPDRVQLIMVGAAVSSLLSPQLGGSV
jgi:hypothetical protein